MDLSLSLDSERYFFWEFYPEQTAPQWRLAYDGNKKQINKYAQQTGDISPDQVIRVSLGTVVLYEGKASEYVKV